MFLKMKIYQRVILLVWLGVSAGFAQAATDCNQVTEIPVSECQSLLELYNSTNGANWIDKTGWNQTNTPCSWFGVGCKDPNTQTFLGHVNSVTLPNNNLVGTLPNFNLPNLQWLYLYNNKLKGSIPNFNLPNLLMLWLYNNQLTGVIPNFNLPNVQWLYLYNNNLVGNIPYFSHLGNVNVLYLYGNQLTGVIPNFPSYIMGNSLFKENCGLVAYNTAQETILNQKDPSWQTKNPNCPVCSYSISPTNKTHGATNENGSVAITTSSPACAWTATSNQDWVNIGDGQSGVGNGTVFYAVTANYVSAQRTATLTIAGQPFALTQQSANIATFDLTVSKTGDGTISANGINCGTDCSETYNANTQVILTATPTNGFKFVNWSGDCSGTTSPLTITMDKAKNCSANFAQNAFTVTLNKTGTGSGTVSGDGNFAAGTTVSLTATADANSTFTGWSPSPCNSSFQMSANNLTCTATFVLKQFALTVNKTGDGTISANGINCGTDCSKTYNANTQVILTATPTNGFKFVNWSGDCSGTTSPLTITMDKAKNCNANFAIIGTPKIVIEPSSLTY